MHLHLGNKNIAKKLPKAIKDYMILRFVLLPDYLELLRCFEYDCQVGSKPAKCVSVFSPNMAREKKVIINTVQDLEKHPEVLLYKGYIDSQGKAYVADRRTPGSLGKATHHNLQGRT